MYKLKLIIPYRELFHKLFLRGKNTQGKQAAIFGGHKNIITEVIDGYTLVREAQ